MEQNQEQIIFSQYHNFRFLLRHYSIKELMVFTGLSVWQVYKKIKETKKREKIWILTKHT